MYILNTEPLGYLELEKLCCISSDISGSKSFKLCMRVIYVDNRWSNGYWRVWGARVVEELLKLVYHHCDWTQNSPRNVIQ